MKYIFLSLLLVSQVFGQRQVGQYKGHRKLSKEISLKMFSGMPSFNIMNYLGNDNSLQRFLGHYGTNGTGEITFENGNPNSINLTLYYLGLNSLAKDLGKECNSKNNSIKVKNENYSFNTWFLKRLNLICRWPEDKEKVMDSMKSLWIEFHNPQKSELIQFEKIESYFDKNINLKANEAVKNFFLLLFIHPNFLLES